MDLTVLGQICSALLALTTIEIVLGIDNVVFIALIVERLPEQKQRTARTLGLGLAMLARIALLFAISWVMLFTSPLFSVFGQEFSGKSIILIVGGLFLLWKATTEIHHTLEQRVVEEAALRSKGELGYWTAITQIVLIDIVFSLDSVITAIGLAQRIWVMTTAIVISVVIMMLFAKLITEYIKKHPTLKMLALAFLLLVGVLLVADGFGKHLERGYVYFAMAFSLFVEVLNLRARNIRRL
jgi:predicted tellurium resistance membrane protein TerC